jgi:hypothetical protein
MTFVKRLSAAFAAGTVLIMLVCAIVGVIANSVQVAMADPIIEQNLEIREEYKTAEQTVRVLVDPSTKEVFIQSIRYDEPSSGSIERVLNNAAVQPAD